MGYVVAMMGHVQDVMVYPILGGTNLAVGMGCVVSRSAYVIQIGMEMIVMCFAGSAYFSFLSS